MANLGKYSIHGAYGFDLSSCCQSFAEPTRVYKTRPHHWMISVRWGDPKWKLCMNVAACDIDLGGGFKYFLCSSLLGEDSHFDKYFLKWVETTNQRCIIIHFPMNSLDAFAPNKQNEFVCSLPFFVWWIHDSFQS